MNFSEKRSDTKVLFFLLVFFDVILIVVDCVSFYSLKINISLKVKKKNYKNDKRFDVLLYKWLYYKQQNKKLAVAQKRFEVSFLVFCLFPFGFFSTYIPKILNKFFL